MIFSIGADARPRPTLTPQALALYGKGFFLVPEDNLAVPLDGKAKGVPFIAPAPEKLELVSGSNALFVIDGDLYRKKDASLSLVARGVGKLAAASSDGNLVVTVEDKRDLKITGADGNSKKVPYHRPGNWEFDQPYVAPDGSWILALRKDFTSALDTYDFLVVDPKSLSVDEVQLSNTFVPGDLRQAVSATQVALQMMVQETDENGFARYVPTDIVIFDKKSKKLGPPPAGMKPGRPSPDGARSLLTGKMFYSDDKSCGADETLVYEGDKHSSFKTNDGQVVSVLDFLPDGSGLIANVLTLKGCKNKGVIIPTSGGEKASSWKPFPLPVHPGLITGRVFK